MDQNAVGDRGGNVSYSKAGLRQAQITGHYNEFQIQNNVFYAVDGQFGALAPIDNVNTAYASANYSLPANCTVSACNAALFALWVASNNTLTVTKGKEVDASKLSGTANGTGSLTIPFPDVVASAALYGLIRVNAGTGTTYTFGTTNFNATNINTNFIDCTRMPAIPLTS